MGNVHKAVQNFLKQYSCVQAVKHLRLKSAGEIMLGRFESNMEKYFMVRNLIKRNIFLWHSCTDTRIYSSDLYNFYVNDMNRTAFLLCTDNNSSSAYQDLI
jgi:hypothetical protein